jgi:predicted metal-binding membrane protein
MDLRNAAPSGATERLLRRDRAVVLSAIAVLFALAGLYTIFGVGMNMTALEMTAMRGMRDMPGAVTPGQWSSSYAILVFLMWWVMMVAMMLPSVSPTVLLYSALLRRGAAAQQVPVISAAFLTGYLAVWAAFAAAATAAQWSLEAAGLVSARMMTLVDTVPGALVLIAAGVFQFTPLKTACLRHCRSPAEFVTRRRRSGVGGALAKGVENGLYCLGCCWFLMALLFVGGIMNLYWIVALTAFVALENLTPFGEAVSKFAGAALILWGGYLLAGTF